jgi:hypothetical protein
MMILSQSTIAVASRPRHTWLKQVKVAYAPGSLTPALEETVQGTLAAFAALGHTVQEQPTNETDILLTTARYGEVLNWRQSLMLTGRIRFKLERNPSVYTLIHIRPSELQGLTEYFDQVLVKEPPDPEDYEFPGLAPQAYGVLFEQGRRGGPILSVVRLLQAQTKSIRILMMVGDDQPEYVRHFDLVGAYPKSSAAEGEGFYEDIALRMVTTVSTRDVNAHVVVGDAMPYEAWQQLETPGAMLRASREFGKRRFFTDMVRIAELVNLPAVADAVSNQYSEGCFASWDPEINALVATITGSARPVDKDNLTEDELVVITGVREGGTGAEVRQVLDKRNDPPSTEAVEMMDMDSLLPIVRLEGDWETPVEAPVVRSKLHGHRGVSSYDPKFVEYVPLDPPYFHYIVSCGTEAQALAVKGAFSRAQSLQNPDDPRKVAFTILPGHGVVITEKWAPGKDPFQVMWEGMDAQHLVIDSHVPQGPLEYVSDSQGQMVLSEDPAYL